MARTTNAPPTTTASIARICTVRSAAMNSSMNRDVRIDMTSEGRLYRGENTRVFPRWWEYGWGQGDGSRLANLWIGLCIVWPDSQHQQDDHDDRPYEKHA